MLTAPWAQALEDSHHPQHLTTVNTCTRGGVRTCYHLCCHCLNVSSDAAAQQLAASSHICSSGMQAEKPSHVVLQLDCQTLDCGPTRVPPQLLLSMHAACQALALHVATVPATVRFTYAGAGIRAWPHVSSRAPDQQLANLCSRSTPHPLLTA